METVWACPGRKATRKRRCDLPANAKSGHMDNRRLRARLDQRAFKWIHWKAPKLIDSQEVSIVIREKPVSTFSHDALSLFIVSWKRRNDPDPRFDAFSLRQPILLRLKTL